MSSSSRQCDSTPPSRPPEEGHRRTRELLERHIDRLRSEVRYPYGRHGRRRQGWTLNDDERMSTEDKGEPDPPTHASEPRPTRRLAASVTSAFGPTKLESAKGQTRFAMAKREARLNRLLYD